MALSALCARFEAEADVLSDLLRDFAATKKVISDPSHFSLLDECFLEGILSRIWQAWCTFCRATLIESCVGTVSGTGANIPALPGAMSEAHVSGAAIQAKRRGGSPDWAMPNKVLRFEPTWGDVDTLVKILTCLRPRNSRQFLAALSSGHPSAKALQLIRNSAAHNNVQSMQEILSLRSTFLVFSIGHPTHAMFWVEPTSKDFLATFAVQQLKTVAANAIS